MTKRNAKKFTFHRGQAKFYLELMLSEKNKESKRFQVWTINANWHFEKAKELKLNK